MPRVGRSLGALTLTCLLTASTCTSGPSTEGSTPATNRDRIVRIGLMAHPDGEGSLSGYCPFRVCGRTFDPQSTSFMLAFEIDRCCFMRTLMSYDVVSPGGSATLAPDLAASSPTVSTDGLTWTFHLRRGLHYAPPMAGTEIVAGDVIRSIERAMTPAGPAVPWANGGTIGGYYVDTYLGDVIVGAKEFTNGRAGHISGLQAPEPYTLEVHLTQPTGDLGYRLAVPGLGPIPANPARPEDPLGVAQGHDFDYGDVIVSSGPYMFEGSERLDLSPLPIDQVPPDGNGVATMTLVRNPSWSSATDRLRRAWADRLEFYRVPDAATAERLVRSGSLDIVLDWETDSSTVERWRADPTLRDRMFLAPEDGLLFLFMNLAIPPFDDPHVRRAINMAIDRDHLVEILRNEGESAEPALHIGVDSYEDNLLIDYDPFGTGTSGDVAMARREMADSEYDTDGDGSCDARTCQSITMLVPARYPALVKVAHMLADQLRRVGLEITVRPVHDVHFGDPSAHVALRLNSWFKDFPDAATFFPVLFGSDSPFNDSMIGASAATLRRLGYDVTSTPSVDAELDQCTQLLFQAQVRCWARLDTYMMEQVVPWAPISRALTGVAVSARVQDFTIDRSIPIPLPAPDSIEVAPVPLPPAPVPSAPSSVPDIPDGLYRTRVSPRDIQRFGGADLDRGDLDENTGTITITLSHGRFQTHWTASHPIFNPVFVGIYEGSGDHVSFDIQAPYPDGPLADLRWRLDGDAIRFTVVKCTGFAADDPNLCAIEKALYEAHPWQLVSPG